MVIENLRRMKLRVALTVLGVVVGSTCVVAMVSLGIGMQANIRDQLLSFQALNQLTVVPGQFGGQGFMVSQQKAVKIDDKLIKKIERLTDVESVSPAVTVSNLELKAAGRSVQVFGISYDAKADETLKIKDGRPPRHNNEESLIAGHHLGKTLLRDQDVAAEGFDLVGKTVRLTLTRTDENGEEQKKRYSLRVVGRADEIGEEQQDYYSVYLPLDLAIELWEWQSGEVNLVRRQGFDQLKVTISSADKVPEVQKKLEGMNLMVFSIKQILEQVRTVFVVIQIILGAIGAVALLVASIGIINTMVMSIYERTREIGIMKAIGASNKDIIKIFLGEAGVIGLIGGLIGVATGWLVAKLLNVVANYYLGTAAQGNILSFVVPWWLAIFAVLFATIVGLVSGVYPALRAARLNPLVALRHE